MSKDPTAACLYSQELLGSIGSVEYRVVGIGHLRWPEAARAFPLSPKNYCLYFCSPSPRKIKNDHAPQLGRTMHLLQFHIIRDTQSATQGRRLQFDENDRLSNARG